MPTKKKDPAAPADAGTVISKIRDLMEELGWAPTASTLDGDAIIVSGKPLEATLPEPSEE